MDLKKVRDILLKRAKKINKKDISDSHAYITCRHTGHILGVVGFETFDEFEEGIELIDDQHEYIPDRIDVALYSGSDKNGYVKDYFTIDTREM